MNLCGKGHELSEENTSRSGACRTCNRDRVRAQRDRREAAGFNRSTHPNGEWRADDVDRVAVDRVMRGQPVGRPLHPREQREIARRFYRAGSEAGLAKMLGTSGATAARLLAEVSE